jgi:transcriptional regulator
MIMYLPPIFRNDDLASQHEVMRRRPFAMLVTRSGDSIVADHIPFMIDAERGEKGTLRAHVARANPLWRTHPKDSEALVVFSGADHYITPSWYATKRETGKVVPTWNYVAVHASGPLVVFDDPEWLRRPIQQLTAQQEAERSAPWAVTDAPADFVATQVKMIVGIEIPIVRIDAKWKVSQNRMAADRVGVVEGLKAGDDDASLAMAALVGAPRDGSEGP